MHDRGDYKMGYQVSTTPYLTLQYNKPPHQLEAEWDEAQKAKEAGEGMDSSDDDKYVTQYIAQTLQGQVRYTVP